MESKATRGTSNSNSRGSAADRRARKLWLLKTFGDGNQATCCFEGCTTLLNFDTITVDRYPIPGAMGGKYTRDNIRPACGPHNFADGAKVKKDIQAASL